MFTEGLLFKYPLDAMPRSLSNIRKLIKSECFQKEWFQIYNFLEFTVSHYPFENANDFIAACNQVFIKELSAYRFIGETIAEITAIEEIESIEQAVEKSSTHTQKHLNTALIHLSNRSQPDYRNSIKESISAIEAFCKEISGDSNATLGKALTQSGKIGLHPALKEAFSNLYGYTSNAEGIRHALRDEDKLDFEDAKFMLVASTAFINYLIVKSSKANGNLTCN